ncbi:MAG: hypothetical protein AAGI17_02090 [Planctomycetota bacterium]
MAVLRSVLVLALVLATTPAWSQADQRPRRLRVTKQQLDGRNAIRADGDPAESTVVSGLERPLIEGTETTMKVKFGVAKRELGAGPNAQVAIRPRKLTNKGVHLANFRTQGIAIVDFDIEGRVDPAEFRRRIARQDKLPRGAERPVKQAAAPWEDATSDRRIAIFVRHENSEAEVGETQPILVPFPWYYFYDESYRLGALGTRVVIAKDIRRDQGRLDRRTIFGLIKGGPAFFTVGDDPERGAPGVRRLFELTEIGDYYELREFRVQGRTQYVVNDCLLTNNPDQVIPPRKLRDLPDSSELKRRYRKLAKLVDEN